MKGRCAVLYSGLDLEPVVDGRGFAPRGADYPSRQDVPATRRESGGRCLARILIVSSRGASVLNEDRRRVPLVECASIRAQPVSAGVGIPAATPWLRPCSRKRAERATLFVQLGLDVPSAWASLLGCASHVSGRLARLPGFVPHLVLLAAGKSLTVLTAASCRLRHAGSPARSMRLTNAGLSTEVPRTERISDPLLANERKNALRTHPASQGAVPCSCSSMGIGRVRAQESGADWPPYVTRKTLVVRLQKHSCLDCTRLRAHRAHALQAGANASGARESGARGNVSRSRTDPAGTHTSLGNVARMPRLLSIRPRSASCQFRVVCLHRPLLGNLIGNLGLGTTPRPLFIFPTREKKSPGLQPPDLVEGPADP